MLSLALATARSRRPSLLKSPIPTASGKLPTVIGDPLAGAKVPSPLPNRMITVLSKSLVSARSALPSWLKSPTAMEQFEAWNWLLQGVFPTPLIGEPLAALKVPSPLPSRM